MGVKMKKFYKRLSNYVFSKINFKRWIYEQLVDIMRINTGNVIEDYIMTLDKVNELIRRIGKML